MCKLGKVCNFFLTLSSEYLRTHVMHCNAFAPGSKKEKEYILQTEEWLSHVTICVIHIEQYFATSKARAATPFELLFHCYRAGDWISLKL